MRALLGILLSIILLQSQVYALSGGPDYNRGGGDITNVVGTYGGVMVEQTDPADDSNGGSVAVYTVNIVQSGSSSGTAVIFNTGRVYPGTVTGIGDATTESATFKAIIEATYNYTLSTLSTNPITGVETVITRAVTATTNGLLDTKIGIVRNGAISSQLMTGTATLQVSNGFINNQGDFVIVREIVYDVSGYRQSAGAAATTSA